MLTVFGHAEQCSVNRRPLPSCQRLWLIISKHHYNNMKTWLLRQLVISTAMRSLSLRSWQLWRLQHRWLYYLRQVNGVNGGDMFLCIVCVCVCLCVCAQRTGQSDQFKTVKATIRTSNLTCMFPGTVRTWPHKNFLKRAWPGSRPPKFLGVKC